MTESSSVAVVGGGLAGLVAARHLATAGHDVTVLEERTETGGRVRSVHEDGFTYDRGFQVLFTNYPAAERELNYSTLDLRRFTPGACIARPGKRSILSDPLRDPGAFTDSLFNDEVSVWDKLRVLKLRAELRGRSQDEIFAAPDATVEEFLYDYGFSHRFVDNFARPFYGGITLDRSLSTSSRVFEYTFKLLSSGSIAVPAAGMGAITDQLRRTAESAGATVETGVAVEELDGSGDGVTLSTPGETRTADAAVVATDPRTARELTGVDAIPTEAESCVTQWLSLPTETSLDAGKRIHLNAADGEPNTIVDQTAVAPEYAPDGTTLLNATFLGERDADDDELADRVRETLAAWYPEHRFDGLELRHTDRIEFAQFAQPPGVHDDLPTVDAPAGPVSLASEVTEWSAITGAMESGRQAARAAKRDLRS